MQQSTYPDTFTRATKAGIIDGLAKQLLTALATYTPPPPLQAVGLRIEPYSSHVVGGSHVEPDEGPAQLRITAHHISWISMTSHAWLHSKNATTRLGGRLAFVREGEHDPAQECAQLWFDDQGNVRLEGLETLKSIGQENQVICEWVVKEILLETHRSLPQCESFY